LERGYPDWPVGLKLGGKLLHLEEVPRNRAVAAPTRHRWFGVRLTGTGFIQVSINRSWADKGVTMRVLASLLTIVLMGAITMGAAEAQGNQHPIDQVARTVVFLHVPSTKQPGGKGLEFGSGFLVAVNERLFLVTAGHVATLMSGKASITMSVENDAAKTIGVSDLTGASGDPKWIVHAVADVAVLPLHPASDLKALLTSRALLPPVLISKLEAPPRDRPLTVIGFPLGLGVLFTGPGGKISPVTRESKAASGLLTLPRLDTKKPTEFFVLDSPSVGGFSGAPVFILPSAFSQGPGIVFSATTLFVGLVHGTASDDTGGKFALVVPSAFVTQTLQRAYEAETVK
jgi:hypothetical protein